jgi:hypothetical protein
MPITPFATTAIAWLWDKYGKIITDKVTDKATEAIKKKWAAVKWKSASEAYRKKIKKLYDTMQIMGMAEPVPLDDIFTEVYMLDQPTAFGRFDIELLKQLSTNSDEPPPQAGRINGLNLVVEKVKKHVFEKSKTVTVDKERNLFILGKPGAGKTTFLKYIAVKAAEQVMDKVPIFVSLKEWADSKLELLPFIAERFDICDFPDAQVFVELLLKSGHATMLFDGLDEVNQESGQRDRQIYEMSKFVEKYDQTQCLLTCRVAASDYSFQPFTYIEIADFTEGQIHTFVSNWFRNKEGERDKETYSKFLAEFERDDNKGLRDLARTPLLLTLLCLAFDATLTFPQRRVEIYEEALDALLKKWDATRRIKRDEVYRKLSLGHKENMLAQIAAETFEKNEYFIQQSELERRIANYVKNIPPHDTNEAIDGRAILKAIEAQHGIFIERARRVYSFSHLTFHEYFTARYIITNAEKGTLKYLATTHCTDGRWREVFLLTTSLLPDASQFMVNLRHHIDESLGEDEKLRALLGWAYKKSTLMRADPWLVRPSCLYVDLHHSCQTNALANALDLAYSKDLDLDRTLTSALILSRDLARAAGPDRAHNPDRTRDLARAFARARDLGLDKTTKEFDDLSIPTYGATAEEWQRFAKTLQYLMLKHRDIGHEWNLTETQEERLANYINASRLLKDCLELAFMHPGEKKAMQFNLYLPPTHTGEERNA